MIALDTSSLIAYFSGDPGDDVNAVEVALEEKTAVLPPPVLTELLSDPKLPNTLRHLLKQLPILALSEGFWERAGRLRAHVLSLRKKARLADTLIAQLCLDHQLPLVTRDSDFKNFTRVAGLKLL
jgi:predicted nucleic acid-binding protein